MEGQKVSGLYLPGMEIPDEFDQDVCIELACGINGNRYARLYNFCHGGLTEWCEIIPVPDCGRLIDADVLESVCVEQEKDNYNKQHQPRNWARAFECFEMYVSDAPTIIPASKGERHKASL